jgi:hypothetical protein
MSKEKGDVLDQPRPDNAKKGASMESNEDSRGQTLTSPILDFDWVKKDN